MGGSGDMSSIITSINPSCSCLIYCNLLPLPSQLKILPVSCKLDHFHVAGQLLLLLNIYEHHHSPGVVFLALARRPDDGLHSTLLREMSGLLEFHAQQHCFTESLTVSVCCFLQSRKC